jgi:hypothetical protein
MLRGIGLGSVFEPGLNKTQAFDVMRFGGNFFVLSRNMSYRSCGNPANRVLPVKHRSRPLKQDDLL